MRILYIVHQFFPKHYYGTERFTLSLAQQMQRLGHYPIVMTYEREADGDGWSPLQKSVFVKKYSYQGIPVISLRSTSSSKEYEIFSKDIEGVVEKLQLGIDLVHVTHPMWLASVARDCKRQGTPLLLTLTDTWLLCPRGLIDRNYRTCKGPLAGGGCVSNCAFDSPATMLARYREATSLLDLADSIATSSHFTADTFAKNGCNHSMHIVPHSIDYRFVKSVQRSPHDVLSLTYIGSIGFHKGLHVLVKALKKAPQSNLRLTVYGSLREYPTYASEILDIAGGDNRIRFLEEFGMESISKIMEDTSLLVVPSVYPDNYPLVILAALAYRVPVIGSRIGGIPEMIQNGVNGFLFQPGNTDELVSITTKIAREPEIVQTLSEHIQSPRRLEEEAFDYENIYTELTQQISTRTPSASIRPGD